jgi:L-threonylcarbamoyladenylate synthase
LRAASRVLRTNPSAIDTVRLRAEAPGAIARAAQVLREGGLVAFPTETVYGLGADATSDTAVAGIFAAKGRPRFNPLIVHVQGSSEAERLVIFSREAWHLSGRFWPGGLTLVLKRRPGCAVSLLASAGLDTLAVRAPEHAVARDLLIAFGRPIAAPSANRSGRLSPTTADHVQQSLAGSVGLILDGGRCGGGIESTVVDLTGKTPLLLRPGLVAQEAIEEALGVCLARAGSGDAPRSPGMLDSHYAPLKPLRLEVEAPKHDEALLAFGPHVPGGSRILLNLSETGDLVEAAARLFAHLHELDRSDATAIAVMPIPDRGLGAAINDRLRRAARR